jgi:hypothetical protein
MHLEGIIYGIVSGLDTNLDGWWGVLYLNVSLIELWDHREEKWIVAGVIKDIPPSIIETVTLRNTCSATRMRISRDIYLGIPYYIPS